MRYPSRLVLKDFRLMLACYPAAFRAEFGPEMYAVFYMNLCEAQRNGTVIFWKLLWRELRGWLAQCFRNTYEKG